MRVLHFGPTILIFIAEVSARANRSLMVFTVTVLVSTDSRGRHGEHGIRNLDPNEGVSAK
jgi:hypothetical protein